MKIKQLVEEMLEAPAQRDVAYIKKTYVDIVKISGAIYKFIDEL